MSTPKTRERIGTVTAFLKDVDPQQRSACQTIGRMMRAATGCRPRMWGASIVGYGKYAYRYASGREGEWFRTGYSPRTGKLSIYIMPGFEPFAEQLGRLGTFKTGKSCLYVKKLEDIDLDVLNELIVASVEEIDHRYPQA